MRSAVCVETHCRAPEFAHSALWGSSNAKRKGPGGPFHEGGWVSGGADAAPPAGAYCPSGRGFGSPASLHNSATGSQWAQLNIL